MTVLFYRTTYNPTDYGFEFKRLADGTWRVYIVSQPSYGTRPAGQHRAHWLSENGRRYVCWTGTLHTLEEAKTVAAEWADRTQRYIATGKRIEEPWP